MTHLSLASTGVLVAALVFPWSRARDGADAAAEAAAAAPVETGDGATEPEPGEPPGPALVPFPDASMVPVLDLDPATLEALAARDHAAAEAAVAAMDRKGLTGATAGDHAFLLAWLRVRAGRAEAAVPLVESLQAAETPPAAYVHLLAGEVLRAADRPVEAVARLEQVGLDDAAIGPRARLLLAEALHEAGRTADARAVYEEMVARPDPAPGNAQALLALATRSGPGSKTALPYIRRIWRAYPGSAQDTEARRMLEAYPGPDGRPSAEDTVARAHALMDRGDFSGAIALLAPLAPSWVEADATSCRGWYVLGRSKFKINAITEAAGILGPAGERCHGQDPDWGAPSLYLTGKALERKKQWGDAARAYQRIPVLYPTHSMADDGLVLAGIGYQEADDPGRATELWTRAVNEYPEGDLTPEAWWRLAWNAWLAGDGDGALGHADRAAEVLPLAQDPVHVQALRYWRHRWRLVPLRDQPAGLQGDAALRQQALDGLEAFAREHPAGFYGLMAAARLYAVEPERVARISHPGWGADPGPWQVRREFLASPAVAASVALARLGLVADAQAELERFAPSDDDLTPGEMGVVAQLMEASGQWLQAHDRLRKYLAKHPPEELAVNRSRLLLHAYPLRYGPEVEASCLEHPWDWRLFHGLVREESNFNKKIVSHAGACGLSQLMPGTAKTVGRWMGLSVNRAMLFEVDTNLKIGARYLAFLMERYKGDPFVSLAGYNAGEGNADRWLRERGNRPVDEYVEAIPFRETRTYVKRVSSTWQMYRVLYGGAPLFPDLSAYVERAVP